MITLVFLLWLAYRSLFTFPVWFDESVGKLIFFGFPVWFYISVSNFRDIVDSLDYKKFHRGLLLGIAYGGIFGFAGTIAAYLNNHEAIQAVPLFVSTKFWWEFMLALLTAFWESIFFFAFVMLVIQNKYRDWSLLKQVLLTALIFAVFHIPNNFLRVDFLAAVQLSVLMFAFGLGQALLFQHEKNTLALILSHSIWGMVLLVHWT